MKIEGGEFQRVYPTEPGTFECTPEDLVVVNVDPEAAAAELD